MLSVPEMNKAALDELKQIVHGEKKILPESCWKKVPFKAELPQKDVRLGDGPFADAFRKNLAYLKKWAELTQNGSVFSNPQNGWETLYPASSEGRMLRTAAKTLRWEEVPEVRNLLNAVIDKIAARQKENGFCHPLEERELSARTTPGEDERRNYDRINLLKGLVDAADAGNEKAPGLARRFADWYHNSPYLPYTLAGYFRFDGKERFQLVMPGELGSSHNSPNGVAGNMYIYHSPYGKKEDLADALQYMVQECFLKEVTAGNPYAISHYPGHLAHCYIMLIFILWIDLYRACGDEKFLNGTLAAWKLLKEHFLHIGSSVAVCEELQGSYPPDSRFIHKKMHTGETCGSVFWIELNNELLQLDPENEKYAAEIEEAIYNVILATQGKDGAIRYHAYLEESLDAAVFMNICCEVNGSQLLANLRQYLYALVPDGIYVHQFADSEIAFAGGTLKCETAFPENGHVKLIAEFAGEKTIRVRIPSWTPRAVSVRVNGGIFCTGNPGTYAALKRCWKHGDTVELDFEMQMQVLSYQGFDADEEHPRCAMMYGPVLFALLNKRALAMTKEKISGAFHKTPDKLEFKSDSGETWIPYMNLPENTDFAVFPEILP